MDLEQLTKHQIVLLTLLVSLVTSIATGIVTVSLMGQAPPSVSRTINQIVERTVETVVPASQGASPATIVTEKTVVVTEDDLAASSIASVQKAVVRIVAKSDPEVLVARGVIVDAAGAVLTDRRALVATKADAFEAILASGARVPATLRAGQSTTSPLVVLDLAVGTSTTLQPAALAEDSKLQLGATVIRIGGSGADRVGTGVLAALPLQSGAHLGLIESSVSSATPGSVLITLFGEVVGITTGASAAAGPEFYTVPSYTLVTSATPTKPSP